MKTSKFITGLLIAGMQMGMAYADIITIDFDVDVRDVSSAGIINGGLTDSERDAYESSDDLFMRLTINTALPGVHIDPRNGDIYTATSSDYSVNEYVDYRNYYSVVELSTNLPDSYYHEDCTMDWGNCGGRASERFDARYEYIDSTGAYDTSRYDVVWDNNIDFFYQGWWLKDVDLYLDNDAVNPWTWAGLEAGTVLGFGYNDFLEGTYSSCNRYGPCYTNHYTNSFDGRLTVAGVTVTSASTVPIPSTLPIFGLGLLGLAYAKRKQPK